MVRGWLVQRPREADGTILLEFTFSPGTKRPDQSRLLFTNVACQPRLRQGGLPLPVQCPRGAHTGSTAGIRDLGAPWAPRPQEGLGHQECGGTPLISAFCLCFSS